MLHKTITLTTLVVLSLQVCAQNEQDILRYSQHKLGGTARVQGAGGAFGAVGADFGSLAINPAGIGFYRRNELSGSAAVSAYWADTRYIGNVSKDSRTGFNLPELGFVYTKVNQELGDDADKGIVSYSFGIGMNRVNDFQQNISLSGLNTKSSVADYFAERANGISTGTFRTTDNRNDPVAMAWSLYLIDSLPGQNSQYGSWFKLKNDSVFGLRQNEFIQNRGRVNEWNATAGMNVSNLLYLGASFIIQDAYYENTSMFSENVESKSVAANPYENMEYKRIFTSSGSGVGGKFGLILRPADYVRLGVAYTTPVRLNMTDEYSDYMRVKLNANSGLELPGGNPRNTTYEYQILTPGKLSLSGAIILPAFGLISVDYDMVEYGEAQFKTSNSQLMKANDVARSIYRTAYNLRVGGEYRLDNMRFRAGYASYGSPYKAATGIPEANATQSITAGIGFIFPSVDANSNDFFIDGAFVNTWGKTYHTPYVLSTTGKTNYTGENEFTYRNFMITAGYRF